MKLVQFTGIISEAVQCNKKQFEEKYSMTKYFRYWTVRRWNDIRGRQIKRRIPQSKKEKIIPIMVNVGIHAEMILRRRIQIREVKVMKRKRRSERLVISIDFSAWLANRWIFGKQFVLYALIYFLFFLLVFYWHRDPFGLVVRTKSV